MNKILPIILLAVAPTMAARTTMNVEGVTYNCDTVFHAPVGPGTTQTQLRLTGNGTNNLDVFYLTVDKTTPGVTFRSVSATDKVAGNMTVRNMASSHSTSSFQCFAGVNADFYSTAGTATNGTSVVGTPTAATICNGEIYKTSNSNYQFSIDYEGIARICRLNFYTGTATKGEAVTLFKGVNVSSPNNGITLYTPRYWGSANQQGHAGNCYQVSAKLAEGSKFVAGGEFDLVVTSDPTNDGDMVVPSDGFVIHGRGSSTTDCNTGAMGFVGALKPGDVVHFNNVILTSDGQAIHPREVVSGNPKNVGNGVNLHSEAERGDASARHPRTMIGVSADGNKIIMMVVDGRTNSSVGITTGMGADIMIFAGAAEAVNLDGGGSSTLYTQGLGVRNHCSDGNERSVGSAIFAVHEAEDADDAEIASIGFRDWAVTVPYYGVYTPVIYGYNKYGRLVNANVTGYKLTTEAGYVSEDGTMLTANNKGCYALVANYNGMTASIPVTVAETNAATPKYSDVLLCAGKPWTVEIEAPCGAEMLPVSAEPYDWSSSDASVATVDEHGVVTSVGDGKCTITGTDGASTITVNVTVETPTASVMAIDPTHNASLWSMAGTGIASGSTLEAIDNGFAVNFKISSVRGTSLSTSTDMKLFSHPEAIQLRVLPKGVKVTKIIAVARANNGSVSKQFTHATALVSDQENTVKIDLSGHFDSSDIGIYPISFSQLTFYLSGSTNTDYRLEVPGVEAVYSDEYVAGVEDIVVDNPESNGPRQWYNLQGIPVANPTEPGMYISRDSKMVVR